MPRRHLEQPHVPLVGRRRHPRSRRPAAASCRPAPAARRPAARRTRRRPPPPAVTAGTTMSTRPNRAASAASNCSPVSSSRRAAAGCIRRRTGREITAGTTPTRTSVNANVAVSTATTMSAAAVRPMPPARAGPASCATTGLGDRAIRCRIAGSSRTPSAPGAAVASSLRSMPELNTGPSCASTMTRTAGSATAASRASFSSARSARDSALRLPGESSVIVATPPATALRTSSGMAPPTGRGNRGRAGRPGGARHTGRVPSTLPDGEPVPADGSLPAQAYAGMADRTLSLYVHVPFCATRCGYCDFNTYTADELAGAASPSSWRAAAGAELDLAALTLRRTGIERAVSTVFVGGGTPSLLGGAALAGLLAAVRERFELAPDAEVTTEANPESTDPALLDALRAAGYTRLSLGLQSTSPDVLRVLDRTHTPGRALQVVGWARSAGFEHVNLDLIYGTPGETDAEFAASLHAATASGADHVSAYSLIVEPGTRLARRIAAGELPAPGRRRARRPLPARGPDPAATLVSPGTRCRTGRGRRRRAAGTTWRTGRAATGGASVRARTRTSAGCAGGTSSIRRGTPRPWRRAGHRGRAGRCWTGRPGAWNGSSCGLRLGDGLPESWLRRAGARAGAAVRGRRTRWTRIGCGRAPWRSRPAAGCSPTASRCGSRTERRSSGRRAAADAALQPTLPDASGSATRRRAGWPRRGAEPARRAEAIAVPVGPWIPRERPGPGSGRAARRGPAAPIGAPGAGRPRGRARRPRTRRAGNRSP